MYRKNRIEEAARRIRSATAGFHEVSGPVGHRRSKKVRPAPEGAAGEQTVVVLSLLFVHAGARIKFKAADGFRTLRPFAAGIVKFMAAPFAAQRMEGIFRHDMNRDISESLRSG